MGSPPLREIMSLAVVRTAMFHFFFFFFSWVEKFTFSTTSISTCLLSLSFHELRFEWSGKETKLGKALELCRSLVESIALSLVGLNTCVRFERKEEKKGNTGSWNNGTKVKRWKRNEVTYNNTEILSIVCTVTPKSYKPGYKSYYEPFPRQKLSKLYVTAAWPHRPRI